MIEPTRHYRCKEEIRFISSNKRETETEVETLVFALDITCKIEFYAKQKKTFMKNRIWCVFK